jgi:hypothetical protein
MQLVIFDQILQVLFASTNDVCLQQTLHFTYLVERFSSDPGKIDGPFGTQTLQCTCAYLEERTDFIAVHPTIFGLFR